MRMSTYKVAFLCQANYPYAMKGPLHWGIALVAAAASWILDDVPT